MSLHWQTFADLDALNACAAGHITDLAAQGIARDRRFRIVLAGGRTPQAIYTLLRGTHTEWSRWEIFFSDERCVAITDAERNARMARECLLDHVPVPAAQIFEIPVELGAEMAAVRYGALVAAHTPFDLVILGVGEDGHTASLFPAQQLDPLAWAVAVHDAPKPPNPRVSLGVRALRATRQVLVLAPGVGKQAALQAWRAGARLPIATVTEGLSGLVLVDRAANIDFLSVKK